MRVCCVKTCPHKAKRTFPPNVSFHGFPGDKNRRNKWMAATGRHDAGIRKNLKVCSRHFRAEDFYSLMTGTKKTLKSNAVPNIFLKSPKDSPPETYSPFDKTPIVQSMTHSSAITNEILEKYEKLKSDHAALKKKHEALITKNHDIMLEWEEAKRRLAQYGHTNFTIERFETSDSKLLYYTGIMSFRIFNILFDFLLPTYNLDDLRIYNRNSAKKALHCYKMSAKNMLFLCLIRLRKGIQFEMLGDLFGVSASSANKIFQAWINLMYMRLGQMDIWPHRTLILQQIPPEYAVKYSNVLGSIDCTEFYIQTPSSLLRQSQCYSNYKGSTTLKALIMTAPNGAILFMSQLFTGSISDKQILIRSGFLKVLREKIENGDVQEGDIILADKGFNVTQLFDELNLQLNIPTFRITGIQFTSSEVENIRYVAHERIHVERYIGRLKNFDILANEIPISALGNMEQIFIVCCLLCNFRNPLRQINTDC